MQTFPAPLRLSAGATRWRLSDLEAYEATCAGESNPSRRGTDTERYLSVKQVADRYATTPPTIWRWCQESRKRGTGA